MARNGHALQNQMKCTLPKIESRIPPFLSHRENSKLRWMVIELTSPKLLRGAFDMKRFASFVNEVEPAIKRLPLTHVTDAFQFRLIMDKRWHLETSQCNVFNERLLYFFYGRPAFRLSQSEEPNALKSNAPICFLLKPDAKIKVRRTFPFDSGGFHSKRYRAALHKSMSIEDFNLGSKNNMPRSLVQHFFGDNLRYFDNSPLPDIQINNLDFEVESFHTLISAKIANDMDDRCSCIEISSNENLDLSGNLLAVVLPRTLLSEDDVLSFLEDWHADPIPYNWIGRIRSNEFVGEFYRCVRDYLRYNSFFE